MFKYAIVLISVALLTSCMGEGPRGVTGNTGSSGQDGTNGTNGIDGTNGTDGTDAINNITLYSSTTCTDLGNGYYGRAVSNNYLLYSLTNNPQANLCGNGHKENINASLSTLWLTPTVLAIFSEPNSLRVITFN